MTIVAAFKSVLSYARIHGRDRFGPDLLFTHWMLYFRPTATRLARAKLAHLGDNAEIRPFCTVIGGRNISIGRNVIVQPFTSLRADDPDNRAKLVIEDDVLLGPNLFMSTGRHHFEDTTTPIHRQGYMASGDIRIRQGAWIGAGAIILAGVTIGRQSVVAAGSVVIKDVPDYTVAAGNPARVIRTLDQPPQGSQP